MIGQRSSGYSGPQALGEDLQASSPNDALQILGKATTGAVFGDQNRGCLTEIPIASFLAAQFEVDIGDAEHRLAVEAAALNSIVKTLVGLACLVIVGSFSLSLFGAYDRSEQIAAYRQSWQETNRRRMDCSRARSLVSSYSSRGSGMKQRPGMMSWNDARLYVSQNCSEEQLRLPTYKTYWFFVPFVAVAG